jgi:hypothetical protein
VPLSAVWRSIGYHLGIADELMSSFLDPHRPRGYPSPARHSSAP